VSKSGANQPSVHPPAAQPSSFQKVRWFPPLPCGSMDLSGFKHTDIYLGINPYAET